MANADTTIKIRAVVNKSGFVQIPRKYRDCFEDKNFYAFELMKGSAKRGPVVIIRCTSGQELYFPKEIVKMLEGELTLIKEFTGDLAKPEKINM